MNLEPELDADERDALRAWATCNVPIDFADRIAAQAVAPESRRASTRAARAPSPAAWWVGMIAAAAAVLLALSLFAADRTDRSAGSEDLAALRLAAHELLLRECTPCHLGEAAGAQPAATAAFDLGEPQWDQRLSSAQLAIAIDSVDERGSAAQSAGFRRYVSAELGRRGGGL